MQIGYATPSARVPPNSDKTNQEAYEDLLSLARAAEKADFDSIWTTEHHFFDDGYSSSPLSICAAIAGTTNEISIGTAIAIAPFYDPIRLAEDAATIDLISNGRFYLGLANGYMRREFEAFNIPIKERARRTFETVEICRGAWSEGSFSYDGKIFEYDNLNVTPTPTENHIPVLLGGTSRKAVDRAAEIADGHLGFTNWGWDTEDADEEEAKKKLDFHGIQTDYIQDQHDVDDDFIFSNIEYVNIADSAEEAWQEFFPSLLYTRQKYAQHSQNRDASIYAQENISDSRLDTIRDSVICGTPDDIVEELSEYQQYEGRTHVIARLYHPKRSFEENLEVIERFGDEVIPRLK
jgi:alkanesulfonate monooxygenase SsuD/methylene tetrahydromethanopterin reductase-like flavin-dependent oxidoreductase (luciferase family)